MSDPARRLALALERLLPFVMDSGLAALDGLSREMAYANAREALTAYRTSDGGDGVEVPNFLKRQTGELPPLEFPAWQDDCEGREGRRDGAEEDPEPDTLVPLTTEMARAQADLYLDMKARAERAAALLSRLEWSASTPDLACCPLCSQKMDDGHSGDCGFSALAGQPSAGEP